MPSRIASRMTSMTMVDRDVCKRSLASSIESHTSFGMMALSVPPARCVGTESVKRSTGAQGAPASEFCAGGADSGEGLGSVGPEPPEDAGASTVVEGDCDCGVKVNPRRRGPEGPPIPEEDFVRLGIIGC